MIKYHCFTNVGFKGITFYIESEVFLVALEVGLYLTSFSGYLSRIYKNIIIIGILV